MTAKKTVANTAELAKHLGLSRWAVSRAINGQPGVSEETVARVTAAMRELRFTPSPHARGLRGQRTHLVGVSFRGLQTPITMAKISQVQRLIRQHGYRPLLVMTEDDPQQGLDVMQNFITMRVEGVIMVDTPPDMEGSQWYRLLDGAEIPHVLLEPRGAAARNAVMLDRTAALEKATCHLLDYGHRRFALLGISRAFPLGVPRYEGVRRALAARGLGIEACVETYDVPERRYLGMRYGRELAAAYLAAKSRATALIALDDLVATGAMWELQRRGVRVPEQCSIVGFDNLGMTDQTNPPLTTVDHNIEVLTSAAMDMLLKLMGGGTKEKLGVVRTPAFLVKRESTGPAPVAQTGKQRGTA